MKTATSTTVVVACTSLREGVTTLRVSARTSLKKRPKFSQVSVTRLRAFGPFRFFGDESSSPLINATFEAILPFLCARRRARRILAQTGRGGGIRTPKFGFGDRQFNR